MQENRDLFSPPERVLRQNRQVQGHAVNVTERHVSMLGITKCLIGDKYNSWMLTSISGGSTKLTGWLWSRPERERSQEETGGHSAVCKRCKVAAQWAHSGPGLPLKQSSNALYFAVSC